MAEWTNKEILESELRHAQKNLIRAESLGDKCKIKYWEQVINDLKGKMGLRGLLRRIFSFR